MLLKESPNASGQLLFRDPIEKLIALKREKKKALKAEQGRPERCCRR
jgi:hypothetical protein